MPSIHHSHIVSFLLGLVAASIVAVVLTRDPDAPPRPLPAANSPVVSTPGPRPPEPAPPQGSQIHIALPSAPPGTTAATDERIATAIESVRDRFPIEDGILRHRVERSTRIALASYRTALTLTPDQADRMAELLWPKLRRDFEATGQIRAALARVKKESAGRIRREELAAVDNEFDVYRRYDADLDRLLDEGPRRYRTFALSVRNLLTADQRKVLDGKEQLVVR